ncbi:MAG: hypothetical protein LBF60_08875 [Treponema sp.]|nr:hypothetical protein [Treponema sp.]
MTNGISAVSGTGGVSSAQENTGGTSMKSHNYNGYSPCFAGDTKGLTFTGL